MKYNFDKIVDRHNTSCAKWDFTDSKFNRKGLLPFWVADMDFRVASEVVDALQKRAQHGVFGYTLSDKEYTEEIVNWRKKRFGWEIEDEWNVYVPNVILALISAIKTFTNAKERIIIQPPVYLSFKERISYLSRDVVTNPLKLIDGRYEIDFEDLEEKAKDPLTKMLVLCNPHNPVGRVYTKEELLQLGEICCRNNILVFSDEIHSDLIFNGYHHIPFASISEEFANNCIIANSIGKTFNLSGLNMANMIIPNRDIRERIKLYTINKMNYHLVPPFGQEALKAAYRYGEDWLEEVLEYIKGNVRYVEVFLRKNIPDIKLIRSEGTYFAWVDFRALGLSGEEIERWFVEDLNIGIYEGSLFGKEGEGFVRINVACPRSILVSCMEKIAQGITKLY